MTEARTTTSTSLRETSLPHDTALAWVRGALAVQILSSIAFAAISMLVPTSTTDGGRFRHAGDYWFTAIGLPIIIAEVVLLVALWRVQEGRAGRLGRAGLIIAGAALVELFVQIGASLALATEERCGPSYVVASFLTFVGHGLFVAGSWRVGLLPRWLLGIWPVVWIGGSFFAVAPAAPLLLAAFYAVMAVTLERRSGQPRR